MRASTTTNACSIEGAILSDTMAACWKTLDFWDVRVFGSHRHTYPLNSWSSALASFRSAVSKPSVNQL